MASNAPRLQDADAGVTAAFELVLTPALFAFFGWLVDRALGTSPVFVLGFAAVVLTYEVWKLWYTYTERMKKFESTLPDAHGKQGRVA